MSTPWLFTWVWGAVVLGAAGLASPASAQTTPVPIESQIAAFDALAAAENQALRAYDWRAEESRDEARSVAESWPQPVFEYMFDISPPWAAHLSTGHSVRLMQRIPRGGAREAQAAPARARAEVAQSEKAVAAVNIWRDIRLDLIEVARINARIELLEEEIELLDDALGVVEAIIPVGRGDHSDLLQIELARESALDQISSLRSRRAAQIAGLVARVGGDEERIVAIGVPEDILQTWLVELPGSQELKEWAAAYEPTLARIDAETAIADAQIEVVDERDRPWPQIMAGYKNMPPMWEMEGPRDQMLQVGISFEIPVFRAQYGIEASRWQHARQAIGEQRGQRVTEIEAQVESALARWESDKARLRRHQTELLPLSQDLANQILIGVELGERNASEFLLALRQEIDLEGRIIDLRAGLLRELMELQRLTGGRLGAETAWAYPERALDRNDGGLR